MSFTIMIILKKSVPLSLSRQHSGALTLSQDQDVQFQENTYCREVWVKLFGFLCFDKSLIPQQLCKSTLTLSILCCQQLVHSGVWLNKLVSTNHKFAIAIAQHWLLFTISIDCVGQAVTIITIVILFCDLANLVPFLYLIAE